MASRKRSLYWLGILLSLVLVLTACEFSSPDSTPDEFNVGCSESELISAINQANNSPGPSVINLEYCIYSLDEEDNIHIYKTLAIKNGLPIISTAITINGNSAVIEVQPTDGEPDFGHFYITSNGKLVLNDLILQNGSRSLGGAVLNDGGEFFAHGVEFVDNIADGDGTNYPAIGGAIFSDGGRVEVADQSVFQNNKAGHSGFASAGTLNQGGAIYSKNGPLSVTDSTFTLNKARSDGGAIYAEKSPGFSEDGTITIERTEFFENKAYRGGAVFLKKELRGVFINYALFEDNWGLSLGGALFSEDSGVSVLNSDFEENLSKYGGAIYAKRSAEGELSQMMIKLSDFGANEAENQGGAIFSENSYLAVENSEITGNIARSCGGIQNGGDPDLDFKMLENAPQISTFSEIKASTISNNSATDIYHRPANGGGLCHIMGDLLITDSVFVGNNADTYGGGLVVLAELEMFDSQVLDNSAQNGGGMSIGGPLWDDEGYPGVNVDITGSMFDSNSAGIDEGGYGGFGGGLLIFVGGTTTINKTTFHLNTADRFGGGIYQGNGDLYLTNSTLSTNSNLSSYGGSGGGIYVFGKSGVNTGLNHVTVAFSGGSGIHLQGSVNLSLYKSLFYQNTGKDVYLSPYSTLNEAGNVVEHVSPIVTSTVIGNVDHYVYTSWGTEFPEGSPMIGTLVGYTHPVLAGSPLIDFLSSCGDPLDQRTVIRPQGTGCEPGAYEYNGEDNSLTNLPDFPQFEPDFNDSSEDCNPFSGLDPELLTLGMPQNTMNLPVVVRVDGNFPGVDSEGNLLSEFSASLGDLQSYQCTPQGFPDRMICMFKMPDHSPGMVLDFSLSWDDCGDPIFSTPLVSIPEPQSGDGPSPGSSSQCTEDLEGDECTAAGGSIGRAGCICTSP